LVEIGPDNNGSTFTKTSNCLFLRTIIGALCPQIFKKVEWWPIKIRRKKSKQDIDQLIIKNPKQLRRAGAFRLVF